MRLRFVFFVLLFACIDAQRAGAQANSNHISIVTEPADIRANEPFHLIITVKDSVQQFGYESAPNDGPQTNDFKVVNKKPSTTTEMNFVNGSFSGTAIYTYTLVPLRTGNLVVMPLKFSAGAVAYRCDTIRIHVSDERVSAADSVKKLSDAGYATKKDDVFKGMTGNGFFDEFFSDTTRQPDGIYFNNTGKVYAASIGRSFNISYTMLFVNVKGLTEDDLSDARIEKYNCTKGMEKVNTTTGTSAKSSYANGTYTELTKNFILTLVAYKEGVYTIPANTAIFRKKKYHSPAVTVVVK